MLLTIMTREAAPTMLNPETLQQTAQTQVKTAEALLEIKEKLSDLIHDGLGHESLTLHDKKHSGETAEFTSRVPEMPSSLGLSINMFED